MKQYFSDGRVKQRVGIGGGDVISPRACAMRLNKLEKQVEELEHDLENYEDTEANLNNDWIEQEETIKEYRKALEEIGKIECTGKTKYELVKEINEIINEALAERKEFTPPTLEKMAELEDEATCPHGFLVGCPTCREALAERKCYCHETSSRNCPIHQNEGEEVCECDYGMGGTHCTQCGKKIKE